MSMEDYDFLFKIVLIGNAGVGKTCLVRRFTQGLFPPGQGATIGVDFMIKTVEINGEKVKLQIWDTAGQERFRSITQSYYRSANALILTYDITCEESFRCLPEWLREIEQYASNKVITVLVGSTRCSDSQDYHRPCVASCSFTRIQDRKHGLTAGQQQATRLIWLKGERSPSRELKNSQKLRTCIIWRPQPRNLIMWRNSSLI
ncbi:ras-related protein Rab-30 isoform X2 [Lemur catta]|uniref:ras-related protein Rab-30 isoform X2 n=1 Tax=Lemur catta TaxID=9447 RepID=UPI001E26A17E|nr:ras-related protein Rab-30 isoform X2 [Lemur catta]